MAEKKKTGTEETEKATTDEKVEATSAETKKNTQEAKPKLGFFKTMFIFLLALSVMLGAAGGAVFYILKNNINNVAENNRKTFQTIPVIKNFLPEAKDPEGEENFSDKEIRVKYTELLKQRNEFRKQLEALNQQIAEKDKLLAQTDTQKKEVEKQTAEAKTAKEDLEKQKTKLAEDTKKFYEAVAKADKAAFKEFYEKVDKEGAKKVYEEVMKEQKAAEGVQQIAKVYETMEPATASGILQELGKTDTQMVVDIFKNIKKDTASQLLGAMDPKFAATISQKLNEAYKPK